MSEIEKYSEIGKEPFIAKIHDVHIEEDYVEWLNTLKASYRNAQIRATVKVNSEKLLWNWQLGRDIVQRKAEEHWGAGIVEQLSLDLQAEFPNEKGFSASNIWYMKRWYLFYANVIKNSDTQKLDQLGQEIHDTCEIGISFPAIFAFVPWRHHIEIIKNAKPLKKHCSI